MKTIRANRYKEIYGEKLPSTRETLEYYASLSPNQNKPEYFVHYSAINKVGINPRQEYETTPLGIYFHPLNEAFLNNPDAYASNNLNIFIIEPNPEANIAYMRNDGGCMGITSSDVEYLFDRSEGYLHYSWLNLFYKEYPSPTFEEFYLFLKMCFLEKTNYQENNYFRKVTKIENPLVGGFENNTKSFAYFLNKILQIDGICDTRNNKSNMIYPNEPQLVVFQTNSVTVVEALYNDTSKAFKGPDRNEKATDALYDLRTEWLYVDSLGVGAIVKDINDFLKNYVDNLEILIKNFPSDLVEFPKQVLASTYKIDTIGRIPLDLPKSKNPENIKRIIKDIKNRTCDWDFQPLHDKINLINNMTDRILNKKSTHEQLLNFIFYYKESVYACILEILERLSLDLKMVEIELHHMIEINNESYYPDYDLESYAKVTMDNIFDSIKRLMKTL